MEWVCISMWPILDCSNWPGKDDVSSGQVYVEYETVEGVVTNGTLKVKK